jgi:hypothetical protein
MAAEYGYDQWDAYMMLSQCGRVGLGNLVDPKYTVGAAICARQAEEVAATVARLRAMGVAATGRALDVSDAPALQA